MFNKKRPDKQAADKAMRAQAMSSGLVVTILEEIVALDDDGIDFLFQMLDSGMWDEWDCSFVGGIEVGFGPAEIRLAAKSGASAAKWITKQQPHE